VIELIDPIFELAGYIFLVACSIAAVSGLRLAVKGETVTSLMGIGTVTTVTAAGLFLTEILFHIEFMRDTAVALLLLGALATIVFARILRGGVYR
jgi:energy-converting hydrogenase B subunit B